MPMTDKKRKTDYEWKRKNKTALTCTMYRGDAEAFRAWCAANGRSVNEALRGYVSQCLGRPLERRDGGAADPAQADPAPEAEPGEDN